MLRIRFVRSSSCRCGTGLEPIDDGTAAEFAGETSVQLNPVDARAARKDCCDSSDGCCGGEAAEGCCQDEPAGRYCG